MFIAAALLGIACGFPDIEYGSSALSATGDSGAGGGGDGAANAASGGAGSHAPPPSGSAPPDSTGGTLHDGSTELPGSVPSGASNSSSGGSSGDTSSSSGSSGDASSSSGGSSDAAATSSSTSSTSSSGAVVPDASTSSTGGVPIVDAGMPDVVVIVDSGYVDPSVCTTCDCDNDGFRDTAKAGCNLGPTDCDDKDLRAHPGQGFVDQLPTTQTNGDWDCNGAVEKGYREDVNCAALNISVLLGAGVTCDQIFGFTQPVACGQTGSWHKCKKPSALALNCVDDVIEARKQPCR